MDTLFKLIKKTGKSGYKILLIIIILTVLDFFAKGLILPLTNMFIGGEQKYNKIIQHILSTIQMAGLPIEGLNLAFYILILFTIKAILIILYRAIAATTVMDYMVSLRKEIFKSFYQSQYSPVTNEVSRITNAMSTQSEAASGTMYLLFQIIQNVFLLLGGILLSLAISWDVLVIAVLLGIIIFIFFRFTISYSGRFGRILTNLNKSFYNNILQAIYNYRYIKIATISDKFFNDLDPILNNIRKTQVKFAILNAITKSISEPIGILIVIVLILVGQIFKIAPEILFTQAVILRGIFSEFIVLVSDIQNFKKTSASVEYCDKLLREFTELDENSGDRLFHALNNAITMKNITFGYNSKKIFDNVGVHIIKNQVTVFLGESGSGKTTLLNLLTGLLKPITGTIAIDDIDISEFNLNSYRSKIGLVTQECIIFNFSIRENLCLRNSNSTDEQLNQYIIDFGLDSIFPNNIIDLDYVIDENSANLSGGQKQRLALIRELIIKPDILILDEATSALDEESKKKIIQFINKLRGTMTTIIVTHQKEYLGIADKAYIITDGKIHLSKK